MNLLNNLHFERPLWFWALIPFIVILLINLFRKFKHSRWEKLCDQALIPFVIENPQSRANKMTHLLTLLSGILLITALAGPSWKEQKLPAIKNQSALVIALDLSQSMNAKDIKPSRLQRAKFKIEDILKKRKDGQTALIVYAGDAFTVTPLTDDVNTILAQIPVLKPEIMPEQGSHAEYAIDMAKDLMTQANAIKGSILLVTDEVNKDPATAAAMDAKQAGYSVSVLGIGTEQGAPIPLESTFLRDGSDRLVIAKTNPIAMAYVANNGGGIFQSMQADNSDVNRFTKMFSSNVNQLKKLPKNIKVDTRVQEGPWFVLLALPFLLLFFRNKKISANLLILIIVPWFISPDAKADNWKDLFLNQNQRAQKAFKKGDHKTASKLFKDKRWKQASDYRLGDYKSALTDNEPESSDDWYNKGNVLAKSGKIDEAIKAYEQSLKQNTDNADARFNKELLEKIKKQQQQNQNKYNKNKKQDKKKKNNKNGKDKQNQQQQSSEKNKDKKNKKSSQQQNNQQKSKKDEMNKKQKQKQKKQSAKNKKEQQKKQKQQKKAKITQQKPKTDEANEEKKQWLRRIPDDPSLLWKRKFYYQYRNRQNKPRQTGEKQW